jgi:hypothetical protein
MVASIDSALKFLRRLKAKPSSLLYLGKILFHDTKDVNHTKKLFGETYFNNSYFDLHSNKFTTTQVTTFSSLQSMAQCAW